MTSLFIKEWVARFDAYVVLHSDQGAAFGNRLLEEVRRMLPIHKMQTTPYHPQTNGLTERSNRTIMTFPRAFMERHQSDRRDEVVQQSRLAYRTSVHLTTGWTPSSVTLIFETVTLSPPD
ncbi:uncharacterized protein DEA37_0007911 [Paragonimus westermani]|uniref:Integrase catalytic domain-containing protein n=1 Tax=Paragonimus westermani TaxID=34504 RepID=A0A5J4N5D9_9TREM|nr:uncharacterized protein DEA37_0005748 [Paragonimus westermani]KAA3671384.1 uncharacterized protein DEA37_0007911 [Paragonimus westermani]